MVVGIGNIDETQLLNIVTKPEYLFTVDDFSDLFKILQDFVQAIPCPPGKHYLEN